MLGLLHVAQWALGSRVFTGTKWSLMPLLQWKPARDLPRPSSPSLRAKLALQEYLHNVSRLLSEESTSQHLGIGDFARMEVPTVTRYFQREHQVRASSLGSGAGTPGSDPIRSNRIGYAYIPTRMHNVLNAPFPPPPSNAHTSFQRPDVKPLPVVISSRHCWPSSVAIPSLLQKAHLDARYSCDMGPEFIESGGQRMVQCLVYLNDIGSSDKGGSTAFHHSALKGLRVRPQAGMALIFFPSFRGPVAVVKRAIRAVDVMTAGACAGDDDDVDGGRAQAYQVFASSDGVALCR